MPGLLKTNPKEEDEEQLGNNQHHHQRDHFNEIRQLLQEIRADRANGNHRLIEPRFLQMMRDDPALLRSLFRARQNMMLEQMQQQLQQQQQQLQQMQAINLANVEANNAAAANEGSNNSGSNSGNIQ